MTTENKHDEKSDETEMAHPYEGAKMVKVKVSCKPHRQQAEHGQQPHKIYRIPGAVLQVGGEPMEMTVTEKEAKHLELDSFLTVENLGPVVEQHDSERNPVRTEAHSTLPHINDPHAQLDDGEDDGKGGKKPKAQHKK